jgi:hypothetical protein
MITIVQKSLKENCANMKARYYIYRNLNKGGFSVKYKGKVIAVSDKLKALNVEFKVSEAGRQRCLRERMRNVHAYAVCDAVEYIDFRTEPKMHTRNYQIVKYNPYKSATFMIGQKRSIKSARVAFFVNGKCII